VNQTKKNPIDPAEVEKEFQRQLTILKEHAVDITPLDEFEKMLKESIVKNRPLRVKCGIDPTASDIHLGHLVPFRKMKHFQDLGHQAVIIIGDYTAMIGDPTGKNETRPPLDYATVRQNASRYMEQIFSVLDEIKTEIRYQTEWFQNVGLTDILNWAGQTTVAKLLAHDTFKNRLESGQPMGLHELFYPMLQGVDSLFVSADVELGGTDQRFNVLMGRDYQKSKGQRPQVAILTPLLTGTCGTQKMSKSVGNMIGVLDTPFDKFGKVMSIPDTLMEEYMRYGLFKKDHDINVIMQGLKNNQFHPNNVKKDLAQQLVAFFHGEEEGKLMRAQFENVFAKKLLPDHIDEFEFETGGSLIDYLVKHLLIETKSEGRRLSQGGGLSLLDEVGGLIEKITPEKLEKVMDESFHGKILKMGKKRFIKWK
jgi:tyrosyl-tRNA synthetase